MSTLVTGAVQSDTFKNKAGTREYGRCTAWVNFNGTGTVAIRDALNVSSITDHGTGTYAVNFEQSMLDTNYTWSAGLHQTTSTAGRVARELGFVPRTLSVLGLDIVSAADGTTEVDCDYVMIQIFGGDSNV